MRGRTIPQKKFCSSLVDDLSLNLSRWLSRGDGISLDAVSFATDRALRKDFSNLLGGGFNVVIHSTGARVVRNWIKLFSPAQSPIHHLIHLAGAILVVGWLISAAVN